MVERSYILKEGKALFRYDIDYNVCCLSSWSQTYHSIEYNFPIFGHKNIIGAFFFFLDYDTAISVNNGAIKRRMDYNIKTPNNVITSCQTQSDIKLLDLRGFSQPSHIIQVVKESGVEVFNGAFFNRDLETGKSIPFTQIKDAYDIVEYLSSSKDLSKEQIEERGRMNKVMNDFFGEDVRYAGQILTDFDNGVDFKKQLLTLGYEGYIFSEEQSSPTVCIFSPDKLSKPKHMVREDLFDKME